MSGRSKTVRGLGAVALVAAVAVALLLILGGGSSSGAPLKVVVFGQQYSWSFGYPEQGNAYSKELHVPVGREVELQLHTDDVSHAFWVQEWAVNTLVQPGEAPIASVTPDKTGTFRAICTQSCGILHLDMRAKVVVEPEADFGKWVKGLNDKVPPHLQERERLDNELQAVRDRQEGES